MSRKEDRQQAIHRMNELVWKRDGGRCILCGSPQIYGVPSYSGAHHILGRTRPESNGVEFCCLLCVDCHAEIHTVAGRGKCLKMLQERYGYFYAPPIQWYIDNFNNMESP